MKTAFSVLALVLLTATAFSQSYEPVKVNGSYGFAEDLSGGPLIIPAQFQYATHFREELALVKQNDRWGYIDATGAWITEPKFDKAQPFTDGRARVYVGGKAGLIGLDGNYIVEPIYDAFEETWYGMLVSYGDKTGLVTTDWKIPVQYVTIFATDDEYINCQRFDNQYDLYHNGKLILEGMDDMAGYYDYGWIANRPGITVKMNGNKGVLDKEGKWIVEPKYFAIEPFYVNEIIDETGMAHYQTIYQLDATEYQFFDDAHESYEIVGSPRYFLADGNGKLLSNEPFESVKQLEGWPAPGLFEVSQNGNIGYVMPDFSLRMTTYNSMTDYLSWKFASDGSRTHILDSYMTEIGVFDEVEIPHTSEMIYDEYGEPTGNYSEEEYLPYVIVKNGSESAVFGLEDQKLVSPWSAGNKSVRLSFPGETERLYVVYDDGSQGYSYYHTAMTRPTGFDFNYLQFHEGGYLEGQQKESKVVTLLVVDRVRGPYQLLQARELGWSVNRFLEEPPGEPAWTYDDYEYPEFRWGFIYYKSPDNRYGIVTDDHKILPAVYDSLVQNPGLDYMLDVLAGGKWGSIDIRNGKTVAPAYDEPLLYQFDQTFGIDYRMFEELGYYQSSDGRKLYSLSGEFMRFKENGRYGLKVYSDFNFTEEAAPLIMVVPPVYKEIVFTDYPYLIIAKGENNKYGLINHFNDTLLPFVHTSINTTWEKMPTMDTPLFELVAGKKKGMYGVFNGEFIPPVYDDITSITNGYMVPAGVVVHNEGKVGVVNLLFEPVLSCTYDGILMQTLEDQVTFYACKSGKWYVEPGLNTFTLTEKKLLAQRGYDLIINGDGYVRTASGYDRYELVSGALMEKDMTESAIHDELGGGSNYDVFVKNGKIGVMDLEGKVVFKPSLTCVLYHDEATLYSLRDNEPTFFVISTGKSFKAPQW